MDLRFGFWTRLGWWCWLALYLLTLYVGRAPIFTELGEIDEPAYFLRLVGVGLIYGAVSQGVWMLGGPGRRSLRLAGASTVTIVGAFLLSVQTEEPSQWTAFLKGFANLAGLVIAQSVVFFLLGIVSWQHGLATRPSRRQFSLLDIVFLTLATAIVLSIVIRLSTPIESSDFWMVAVGIWVILPCVAAVASIASTATTLWRRIAAGSLAVLIIAAGCAVLVALEDSIGASPTDLRTLIAKMYASVLATFCGCCVLFPHLGRIDEAKQQAMHRLECQQDSEEAENPARSSED